MNRPSTIVESLTLEMLPRRVETDPNSRRESGQDHWELQPREISALLTSTEPVELADEALELIDMRYQQALALLNLQHLFTDGQLDGM